MTFECFPYDELKPYGIVLKAADPIACIIRMEKPSVVAVNVKKVYLALAAATRLDVLQTNHARTAALNVTPNMDGYW